MLNYIILATLPLLPITDTDNDNSVMDYVIYTDGPRTVYEGAAKLKWDENVTACVTYTFDLVPGRLAGSPVSSQPGEPMLPYDEVIISNNEIYISWERNRTDLWPTPTECHRRFKFFVIKTCPEPGWKPCNRFPIPKVAPQGMLGKERPTDTANPTGAISHPYH